MLKRKIHHKNIADQIGSRTDLVEFLDSNKDLVHLFDLPTTISKERVRLFKSLYLGIGNTPCYTIRLPNNNELRLKMEYCNTMGNNHYARCWIPYLFIAETLGITVPNDTHLLEVTSGSAGISLSMAAKYLGYNLTLIVPEMLPVGRTAPMEYYGANVIKVSGYIDKCIEKLHKLLESGEYFPCNHSEEKADILVKVDKRIATEYCKSEGIPDYSIIGLGNGTSTYSIFNYLKKMSPTTHRVTYHPSLDDFDVVYGLYGPNVKLRHVDPALSLAHERIITSNMNIERVLTHYKFDTEIVNLGLSSLYAIVIALEKSNKVKDKTFFTIGYDKNDRYE